jgi:hypothetical protein
MDIEKLKGSWQRYTNSLNNKDQKDEGDLKKILVKRSQRSLRLLQRNFFIEAGLNVLLIPLIVLFILNSDFMRAPYDLYFSALVVLILLVFLYYMYDSYKKIYRYENSGLQLKDKLKEQIGRIEKFIRDYYRFLYGAYFLGLLFGLSSELPGEIVSILIRLGVGLAFGVGILFLILKPFARFYIRKLYGAHLESLKRCLSELEDNLNENNNEDD